MPHTRFQPVDLVFEGVSYDVPVTQKPRFPLPCGPPKRQATKSILHAVTGSARSGELLGILGPSGSGKTTLLNVIAGRSEYPPKTGKIWYGGRPRSARTKRRVAYIMQDEVFFSNLTVRETLEFTADVRIPDSVSHAQKMQRIDQVVERLGLSKCLDTRIGNPQFNKGISGGERKRLNVANEMLHEPSVFLVDECTSGIDSASALNVINMFHELSREGRTVVATIHQPSSRMFPLFDRVMLLSDGHVAYFGPPERVTSYFQSIGLPFPTTSYNPADYLLDLVTGSRQMQASSNSISTQEHVTSSWKTHSLQFMTGDNGNSQATHACLTEANASNLEVGLIMWDDAGGKAEGDRPENEIESSAFTESQAELRQKEASAHCSVQQFLDPSDRPGCESVIGISAPTPYQAQEKPRTYWDRFNRAVYKRCLDVVGQSEKHSACLKYPAGWGVQFRALALRSWRQKRGALLDPISLVQLFLVILVAALCFFQIALLEETIEDRLGFLSFVCVFWALHSTLGALFAFPGEKQVLKKERSSGSYRLTAYYLAKTVTELPADMLYPFTFSVVLYFIIGLNPTFVSFLLFTLVVTLNVNVAQSLGLLISAVFMDIRKAQVFGSLWVLFAMLLSGYYINPENFPGVVEPFRVFSFIRYSYEALVRIELLSGRQFDCGPDSMPHTVFSDNGSECPVDRASLLRGAGLDEGLSIGANIAVLIAWIGITRTLAYFALKVLHKP